MLAMYDIQEFELDWSLIRYFGSFCPFGLHIEIRKMQTMPLAGQGNPVSYVWGQGHPMYHL